MNAIDGRQSEGTVYILNTIRELRRRPANLAEEAVHGVNQSLAREYTLTPSGHRMPTELLRLLLATARPRALIMPEINLVVTDEIAVSIRDHQHLRLCPVTITECHDLDWRPYIGKYQTVKELIAATQSASIASQEFPRLYEVLQRSYTDVISNQLHKSGEMKIRLRSSVSWPEVLQIWREPDVFETYGILSSEHGLIISKSMYDLLKQYFDLSLFDVVKIWWNDHGYSYGRLRCFGEFNDNVLIHAHI